MEKQTRFEGGSGRAGRSDQDANANEKWAGVQYGKNIKLGPVIDSTTTGWIPTCTCGENPVPCTVLDPFSGSGTVGVVSTNLKQNYIGIELNPDYILLSQQRLNVVYDKPVIYNLNKE